MKKRILFVDDEPNVLQGMKRMLRSLREDWDLNFANSGAEALELMKLNPVDVLVTDMKMPSMTGADLVNETLQQHPKTIRIILSGYSDQDLILQSICATHQFLAKPCDPPALLAALERAKNTEKLLSDPSLCELLGKMKQVPSIPQLYKDIHEQLKDKNASIQTIGAIIAQDIGMTASILKLVNSAFFGLPQKISHPTEAVNYLGLEIIRSLVLVHNFFEDFKEPSLQPFVDSLWQHSFKTAEDAYKLAKLEQCDTQIQEQAYSSGLLHDIGRLILTYNFPEAYQQILKTLQDENITITEAEKNIIGASHTEIGSYLIGLWGLPLSIVESISFHHSPEQSADTEFTPLAATHIAAMHHQDLTISKEYLEQIGLSERLPIWLETLN